MNPSSSAGRSGSETVQADTGTTVRRASDTPLVPEQMRVIVAALQYDYGRPERGYSFEYYNLYLPAQKAFGEVQFFDFVTLYQDKGRAAASETLLSLVRSERPDLVIVSPWQDELDPELVEQLRSYTTTVGYFLDDMWRRTFALRWAPRFDYFTTTSSSALRDYRDRGLTGGVWSPLGYNPEVYIRKDLPKRHDVTFVGGFHGHRDWMIRQLRRAGINTVAWGNRWSNGRLSQAAMVDVFNQSKISLNLSNCLSFDLRYLFGSPRWFLSDMRRCKKDTEQIKGRHFELNGSGAFQLSYYVEDLERCYDIGEEIVIFMDLDDLVAKIRYFLKHEDEREAIAEAGYRRAVLDHTMERRFLDLVETINRRRANPSVATTST